MIRLLLQIKINKYQERGNKTNHDGMNGLKQVEYWEDFTADTVPVLEPKNTFKSRYTTVKEEVHNPAPQNFNYSVTFKRE